MQFVESLNFLDFLIYIYKEDRQVKKTDSGYYTGKISYIEVKSSFIKAIKYKADDHVLVIKFVSGETYLYFGVRPFTVCSLLCADSKGQYFIKEIKDKYECTRV